MMIKNVWPVRQYMYLIRVISEYQALQIGKVTPAGIIMITPVIVINTMPVTLIVNNLTNKI